MFIYIFFFILTVILYFATRKKTKKQKQAFFLMMVALALFVGISDMLGGYDRYIYAELFDDVADIISLGENPLHATIFEEWPREFGYGFFNIFIALFTRNRYIFIFITTIVIYILYYISLKKYTNNNLYALIIFFGLLYFFTFTYLRQMIGVSIAWFSIKYVWERKLWKFLAIVAVAFTFHNSAIVLVPCYLIPLKKFSKVQVLYVMGICFLFGLSPIPNTLFSLYGETTNDMERLESYATVEVGFRIEYILESVFFLFFVLRNYNKIPEKPQNIFLLNLCLAFCALLLIFVQSQNGGRLGWYYVIGVIATIEYICTAIKKNNLTSRFLIVVMFALFFRVLDAWDTTLYPYKTFFTNGIRYEDQVREQYEYDSKYDYDKFYR